MNAPNPFDFSDFGPPRRPSEQSASSPGSGSRPAPGSAFSIGFDPWDNASKSSPHRGSQDAFASSDAASDGPALSTAGPPLVWFAVALALALVGSALALGSAVAGFGYSSALLGWLLAGPTAIGALALYTRVDTRRRTTSIYSAPRWTPTLYWMVVGVCLIGIVLSAWQIALWAGRR